MVQEEPSFCGRCDQECYGDVINAHGKYYHQYGFTCTKCSRDLIKHGYFVVDGQIYCNNDYYKLMGTKCSGCGKFVEGEVVAVLDSTFHPECFGCNICGKLFPPGAKIAFDGDDFICEDCDSSNMHQFSPKDEYTEPISEDIPNIPDDIPEVQDRINEIPDGTTEIPEIPVLHNDVGSPEESKQKQSDEKKDGGEYNACAGCRNPIKSGQALLALDKQWHLWCFTCNKCGCLLAGEYMGRDGVPYCEDDYQTEFGVSCAGCGGYITGKVLQAGEKHYHPHCSRCAKCGRIFGEGEEMYLQGSDIWHPQCSEDYRRENEEAALNEANAKRLPPSYENTVESMLPRTQSFTISSEDNLQNHADNESIIPSSRPGPPPYHNRSSDISEGDKYTNPPPYHVKQSSNLSNHSNHSNNSYEQPPYHVRNISDEQPPYHIRNTSNTSSDGANNHGRHSSNTSNHSRGSYEKPNEPPAFHVRKVSNNTDAKSFGKPLSSWQSSNAQKPVSKPLGFRSVKPPQPVITPTQEELPKLPKADIEDDDEDDDVPPPIPPPPTRSSSNSWKQKYSGSAYVAKPFIKQAQAESRVSTSTNKVRSRPLSFVESAYRKTAQEDAKQNSRTSSGSLSSNPDDYSKEPYNPSSTGNNNRVKGVGYNKLQLRKMKQQQKQTPKTNGYSPGAESTGSFNYNSDSLKRTGSDSLSRSNSTNDKLQYLTDDEFLEVFQMSRDHFYAMPKWKQTDLRKTTHLK